MDQSKRKIIVAGAGIAGLSCSQALLEAGYNVELLEASKHIGGRIRTLKS